MEQSIFQERFKRALFLSGIRKTDLAEKAGIDRSKITSYANGRYKPNAATLAKLAAAMDVSPSWLIGESEEMKRVQRSVSDLPLPIVLPSKIPVIGDVAAGVPIPAQEDIVGSVYTEKDVFALRIKGDSMSPRIMDGDVVLVDQNACPEDGDVVIALVGDEATCKILKKTHDRVTLVPFNAAYPPFVYTGDEIADLHVLGVVVESRHEWR